VNKLLKHTLVFFLLPLLASCGFHLRGDIELPPQWRELHLVSASPHSELSTSVRENFEFNDIRWVEPATANFVLYLGNEKFERRNLTIDRDAQASQYELELSTTLRITDRAGNVLLPEASVKTLKVMTADPDNITGKVEESRLLQREMRADLVQQIMRRVRFLATTPSATQAS
jgi:LPS-assembly lipoprotein